MVGEGTEEQDILHDQHLDLIYPQSGTLYNLILNDPQPSVDRSHSKIGPSVVGVVRSVSTIVLVQLARNLGQLTISINPSSVVPIPNPSPTTSQTFEVHIVQNTSCKQPRGKKKNKGKLKKFSFEKRGKQSQQLTTKGSQNKRKVKYPCMICKEYHFTKDCPHLVKVHQFLEQGSYSSQPAVLTNPFPPRHQQMVSQNPGNHQGHPPQGGAPSNANIMMLNFMIGLFMRANNYDIPKVPKDQPSTSQSNGPLNIEKPILGPFLTP